MWNVIKDCKKIQAGCDQYDFSIMQHIMLTLNIFAADLSSLTVTLELSLSSVMSPRSLATGCNTKTIEDLSTVNWRRCDSLPNNTEMSKTLRKPTVGEYKFPWSHKIKNELLSVLHMIKRNGFTPRRLYTKTISEMRKKSLKSMNLSCHIETLHR